MLKSKLIVYLQTLSTSEMRDLGQFISFKSSNNKNDIILLFNYLKKLHPTFPEKKVQKEIVSKKLFKNEANQNKKLLNSMYRLNLLIDDFFVQEILATAIKDKDFLLLKALRERKLDKYFFKKIDSMQNDWNDNPKVGIEHLYDEYRLKEMCFSHPSYSLVKEMPLDPALLLNHIDEHYFATKLYWNLCLYNTQNYVSKKKNSDLNGTLFLDEIINSTEKNLSNHSPQTKLFSRLIIAFRTKNYTEFDQFKNAFFNNLHLYNYKEKVDIQTFLYHACYENYKTGVAGALDGLFELNCFAIEYDLIIEGGYISNMRFWNIIHIGFAAKKLNWTEKFIEDYGKYLQSEQKEDTILICKALLAFNFKKYEHALQLLATARFQNMLYALYTKSLQLQCYYELGDEYDDLFWNLCKSFNSYLNRREEFSENTKTSFSNFIYFSKLLLKTKHDPNKNLERLSKKINNNLNLAYKSWILEKLDEQLKSN